MNEPLFLVREPETRESPVVVEIPHAGLHVPPLYLASLVAPARCIARDADLYVDELYEDAAAEGATVLVARTSRYVLDLNRAEDDVDADAVRGSQPDARMPRGVVWRLTREGDAALARPLTKAELEARLDDLHRPYHRTLAELLERKRSKFGFAVLLAAHSMPSGAKPGPGVPASTIRADVVPGTQGRTTASAPFIDAVDAHARGAGLSVRHDEPYRGGFSTRFYGRPRDSIHAVQVELARRLYMNEETLEKSGAGFERTRAFCRGLVRAVGNVRPL